MASVSVRPRWMWMSCGAEVGRSRAVGMAATGTRSVVCSEWLRAPTAFDIAGLDTR